ncbi:PRD domain-containing protein [Enterococcus sp. BWR-S5]|uniref:PRD domain-containing protein n=1 Tax=Enterococcus sp. BWR-S5 TaxID=2787714 RepID=UPI001924A73C|nr:PRD domain-containing protein [Enterococcus sp. BWR-S5]MBL1227312.1 PRD domain-containing protein [Enterococcus sp. BWR-S5]
MKISQILNNNVALVKRGGCEVFVVSKGIGFRRKKGEQVPEHEIEKMYILDSYDMLDHFSYLLSHSDPNDIILIDNIISYSESELGIIASDYLSLTLLDHLEFLLKRVEKNQFIKSPLIWDIKRFYPKHFEVGLKALQMITEQKGIELPEDEAVSLTLHFVNMEESRETKEDRIKEMRALSDIVSIIELHFQVKLDERSTNYMRFTTHLQYFVQRIIRGEIHEDEKESLDLYKQVSQLYSESFKAVQKIKVYIKSQFKTVITVNEETYLMLHINRVTERLEEK